MPWPVPEIPVKSIERRPIGWWPLLLLCAFVIVAALITLLSWPAGKASATTAFWIPILYWPFSAWLIVVGFKLEQHEAQRLDHVAWNLMREEVVQVWRRWIRQYVKVLGHQVVMAEDDMAIRVAGLDGGGSSKFTGKPMALALPAAGAPRINQMLETLLDKLKPILQSCGATSIEVVLHAGDAGQYVKIKAIVERFWHQSALPGPPSILIPEKIDTDPIDILNAWIDKPFAGVRLVLAWQLKSDSAAAPEFTETAVGFLLTDPCTRMPGARQNSPVILRPMLSALNELTESVEQLNTFEPVPKGKIKHVWSTGVGTSAGMVLQSAFSDTGVPLRNVAGRSSMHDLDQAAGKPGPVSYWLTLAAGLDLIAVGHGAQCIAQAAPEGMSLTPIGSTVPKNFLAATQTPISPLTLGGTMASLGAMLLMGGLWFQFDHSAAGQGAAIVAIIVALAIPVQLLARYLFRFRYVETQMRDEGYAAGIPANGRPDSASASLIAIAEADTEVAPTAAIRAAA